MASWVLSISKDFPQHWGYAVAHGMWDLRSPRPIRAGDLVHFWQSGPKGGWVGRARATEDAYDIDPEAVARGPWDDWPGDPLYRSRFGMEILNPTSPSKVRWTQVREDLGVAINPGWDYPFSAAQERVLASYFGSGVVDAVAQIPEETLDDAARARVFADLSEDLRVRAMQVIALRQGQPAFRRALITAYGSTCAVTGTSVERVLEAAHIAPYKGVHTNEVTNGLLLRADIHTLFDLRLLTVTPDLVVHVAPEVSDGEYARLDKAPLACVPPTLTEQPDSDQLRLHNERCGWLGA
jgi:putative restriction endonuclease